MNIICNYARKLLLVHKDSAKKELSKTDGLVPRYEEPWGVGVHVDISTHRQERLKQALKQDDWHLTGGWFRSQWSFKLPISGAFLNTVIQHVLMSKLRNLTANRLMEEVHRNMHTSGYNVPTEHSETWNMNSSSVLLHGASNGNMYFWRPHNMREVDMQKLIRVA